MFGDAASKLSRARKAVVEAREAQAGKLVLAATAGSAVTQDRSSPQQARLKELECEDELEAARSALSTVEQAGQSLTQQLPPSRRRRQRLRNQRVSQTRRDNVCCRSPL
jgi:hypothetical protein